MELWIRSQNKKILLKVNELKIEINMIIAFDGNEYQYLGAYKTKERALEVLDEIQNVIYLNKLFNADVDVFNQCLRDDMKLTLDEANKLLREISVYEMPVE